MTWVTPTNTTWDQSTKAKAWFLSLRTRRIKTSADDILTSLSDSNAASVAVPSGGGPPLVRLLLNRLELRRSRRSRGQDHTLVRPQRGLWHTSCMCSPLQSRLIPAVSKLHVQRSHLFGAVLPTSSVGVPFEHRRTTSGISLPSRSVVGFRMCLADRGVRYSFLW